MEGILRYSKMRKSFNQEIVCIVSFYYMEQKSGHQMIELTPPTSAWLPYSPQRVIPACVPVCVQLHAIRLLPYTGIFLEKIARRGTLGLSTLWGMGAIVDIWNRKPQRICVEDHNQPFICCISCLQIMNSLIVIHLKGDRTAFRESKIPPLPPS